MQLIKPKFWDKNKGLLAVLLLPITFLYILFISARKKLVKPQEFKIPILCIGNIYMGGTGKTPVSIFLAKKLSNLGVKAAIIRKYYKNHRDEHILTKEKYNYFFLDKKRSSAIKKIEGSNFDLGILDDGFQDYTIKKDFNIICFNERQFIGNGLVFPSGPLRENLYALKRANVVIINGVKDINLEKKLLQIKKGLEIYYSNYIPKNLEEFKDKDLLAFAGIGNPDNFFNLLSKYGLKVKKKLYFPDHYNFSKEELRTIIDDAYEKKLQIITTEKDYVRIKSFKFKEIKYLKIELIIKEEEKLIKKIYDQIN